MKASSFLVILAVVSNSRQNPLDSSSQDKFVIPRFKANWHSAVEHCNFIGMRLAVIESAEKGSKLYEAVKTSDVYVEAETPVWVGASDLANEGYFHWHATGILFEYSNSNWADGQPNNKGGGEHCMEAGQFGDRFYGFKWQWNDVNCSVAHYFICEHN